MAGKKVVATVLAVIIVLSLCCCVMSSVQALEIFDGFEGGIVDKPVVDAGDGSEQSGILTWIINFFKSIIDWIKSLF